MHSLNRKNGSRSADERFFAARPGRVVRNRETALYVTQSGQGPPLVFIHGLGWSHALWHRQIERYSQHYEVIAADTRGHGGSDAPPGPYTMQQLAADWADLTRACGIERFAAIGFSQGGMIAMMLAATYPERVGALGLFGTACRFSDAAWSGIEQRAIAAKAAGRLGAAQAAARSIFSDDFAQQHPDFVRRFVELRAVADADALTAATQSLRNFSICEQLAGVKCPVLILHGTADKVIAPDNARELHRLLPQSECHFIKGAGHMLPIECPDDIEANLNHFLNTHYPAEEM